MGAAFLLLPWCSSGGGGGGTRLTDLVDGGDLDLLEGDLDRGGGDRDLERLLDDGGERRRGEGEGEYLLVGERRGSKSLLNLQWNFFCWSFAMEFCETSKTLFRLPSFFC